MARYSATRPTGEKPHFYPYYPDGWACVFANDWFGIGKSPLDALARVKPRPVLRLARTKSRYWWEFRA